MGDTSSAAATASGITAAQSTPVYGAPVGFNALITAGGAATPSGITVQGGAERQANGGVERDLQSVVVGAAATPSGLSASVAACEVFDTRAGYTCNVPAGAGVMVGPAGVGVTTTPAVP